MRLRWVTTASTRAPLKLRRSTRRAGAVGVATGSKKANADEFENMREYKPQVLATPPLTKPHVAHVLSCAIVAASRLHGTPVERITEEKRVAALRTRKNTGGGFAL